MCFLVSAAEWLDNADVYVGSCPSNDITSNRLCGDLPNLDGAEDQIGIRCPTGTYGRYVYVLQQTESNNQIALCEVEVYGDDGKTTL